MNLKELKERTIEIITNLKDNGKFPKENNLIDYKQQINILPSITPLETFMINFAKDIISYSNSNGGIIIIGIKENKSTGNHEDIGLNTKNIELLNQIDLNDVSQKFEKISKVGISIDLQFFQISTRKFYYLIIEKNNQIIIPLNDYRDYKLNKGEVWYRGSSKNELANKSTTEFNRFLQIKANERSKEFMEIWSKLLPEMVDINPREVLILNPIHNKIYGFNSKEGVLSSGDIEIDKTQDGVFNIILEAITAGEIGKITTNEGKPLYKIIGEYKDTRERISMNSLMNKLKDKSKYKFSNLQLKDFMHHLGWVTDKRFQIENPKEGTINPKFDKFIWIGIIDSLSNRKKVLFSIEAIEELFKVTENTAVQEKVFGQKLLLK